MAESFDADIGGVVLFKIHAHETVQVLFIKILQASELSNLSFMTAFLSLTTKLFVEQKHG